MGTPRIDKIESQASLALANSSVTTLVDVGKIAVPYTTIVGRAQIPNLAADGAVRFGIERVMTQSIQEIQNEFGPNGERVFGVLNDSLGLIRFVGNVSTANSSYGVRVSMQSADFVEIVFYGTGLNILMNSDGARTCTPTVDGAVQSAVTLGTGSSSGVLGGRNYAPNQIVTVVPSVSVGLHTVKLTGMASMDLYGFEILNTSSTLVVNPVTAYGNNTKATLAAQATPAYNSGFETGSLGTRGGHVLVYLKSDGTIAKAVTPTGAAQANLTSADHTNEEVVKKYNALEFGAGRDDDFSFKSTPIAARAFTLDDGTTTLVSNGCRLGATVSGAIDIGSSPNFLTLTFVGTGLDVLIGTNGSTTGFDSVSVDGGSSLGSINIGNSANKVAKIVSGLPYGTHTVKLLMTGGTNSAGLFSYIVYAPKKPALPAGAVELADYYVMAEFVKMSYTSGSAFTELYKISAGVLRKVSSRERTYVGTWTHDGVNTDSMASAQYVYTVTSGSYYEYSFVGTGIELGSRFWATEVQNWTISIDGVTNFSSAPYVTNFSCSQTGVSWNSSNGTCTGSNASNGRYSLSVTGLTFGLHKVKILNNAALTVPADTLDIITPIHSPKSNLYGDLQNTLPVGSCAIQDNRQYKDVKLPTSGKAWAQAVGVTGGPATGSTSFVPVPDMSLTIKTTGGPLEISFDTVFTASVSGSTTTFQIYVDGVATGIQKQTDAPAASGYQVMSINEIVTVGPGIHKVDAYWKTQTGSITATSTHRLIVAKEN